MFKYHILALLLGTIIELFVGRLYGVWNPFDAIYNWAKYLDRALLGDELILLEPSKQRHFGVWLLILVLLPAFIVITFFTLLFYEISPVLGILFEAVASYFCFEANHIFYTSREVMCSIYGDDIETARSTVHTFTRVDTDGMDVAKLSKATITKVANEAGDSCISPMIVLFLFGPIGGVIYRSVDIIDGIVGHKEKRYEHFGLYPARVNKILDYIPGRFSGWLAVICARHTFGGFNGKNARYIHLRDKYKAVSAFAGALEVSLKNDTIGDDDKPVEPKDIKVAAALLRNMFIFCQCVLVILLVFF